MECDPSHQDLSLTAKRLFRLENFVDLEEATVLNNETAHCMYCD